jgi:uncharacterized protein
MQQEITLVVTPKQASDEQFYLPLAAQKLNISLKRLTNAHIIGRSIDARGKTVKINLRLNVFIDEHPPIAEKKQFNYKMVHHSPTVVVVGAGPAGLFAALKLIELGLKPIVIERGKDVITRKRDIAAIHRNHGLNPDSNYGFGEGGAGTYSDGKLYTRSKKRGSVTDIFEILYTHGANPDILIDAHPHIGSDKLPQIIQNIRQTIQSHGGEVHFETNYSHLLIKQNQVSGIALQNGDKIESRAVMLATGHSARDVYYSLAKQSILLEAKPFAMGVRIEHPQALIDSIQYSCTERGPYLPAATYSLVHQAGSRGVYSFCMCPGGIIVPASTNANEMVVNGMSPSGRNTQWANSGLVVELQLADTGAIEPRNAMKNLEYQIAFEQLAFNHGGQGQIAPAQRVTDFLNRKLSANLPQSSFRPGLQSSELHQWMPDFISTRLAEGLKAFDQKMKGFITADALLIGVESRTSSPLRIPRDAQTWMHPQIKGLFPCGEGSGYAGGIASSAIDGQNSALKLALFMGINPEESGV